MKVLLCVLLLAGLVPAGALAAVPTGLVHDATIYHAALDQTSFWYSIWPTSPAVSHVVIGLCGDIIAVSWPHSKWGYDPTTDFSGLKLDSIPALEAPLAVEVVMAGERSNQPIQFRVKAGQEVRPGNTYGPGCEPNAVALSGLTAEPAPPQLLGIPLWSSSVAGAGRVPSWLSADPPFLAEQASGLLAQPAARQWARVAWRTLLRFGRVVPSP